MFFIHIVLKWMIALWQRLQHYNISFDVFYALHLHIFLRPEPYWSGAVTAGAQFPGFRRDFFRVPVSVCVLFGCIAGQKPTRRHCAFALFQRFRRIKMSFWAEKTEEVTSSSPPFSSSSSSWFIGLVFGQADPGHLLRQYRRTGATFTASNVKRSRAPASPETLI